MQHAIFFSETDSQDTLACRVRFRAIPHDLRVCETGVASGHNDLTITRGHDHLWHIDRGDIFLFCHEEILRTFRPVHSLF